MEKTEELKKEKKGRKPSKRNMGFLTENERKFLEGEGTHSNTTARYYKSNIRRKAKQAILDLQLIFKKLSDPDHPALCFLFPKEGDVYGFKPLIREAAWMLYNGNCLREIQNRRKAKTKRKINEKAIKAKTARQLQETITATLNDIA